MAELKSSQRISYKATYNQISPSATADSDGTSPTSALMRAVEKTAFVQALRIIPQELAAITRELSSNPKTPPETLASQSSALSAIEKLLADKTAMSTLNNAALFASIAPSALVAVAKSVLAHRQTAYGAVNTTIASIVSAYRGALAPATPPTPSSPASAPAAKPPKGATVEAGTSDSGMAVVTTVLPFEPSGASRGKTTVQARGESIRVVVDESKGIPAAFASVLAIGPSDTYTPANSDALVWAEKYQPKMFAGLVDQLQPYLGLSVTERSAVGGAKAILDLLGSSFAATFDAGKLGGLIAGFQSRMFIEPVGFLHLERIEMYPAGVERGELVHSVPLTPGETVNISHKEWSVTSKEFEDIVQDYFEGYSEQGVAEKNDIAMSNESQSQHATALNVGASLSASYSAVTLSTSFGYNSTNNDTQSKKDSRNHSITTTKQASARTKKDHKVTFKVTSVAGTEDQSVRVISNPSATDSMRIDYFQLARKWKLDLLRYGLRMTYDIVIPNPGSGIVTLVDEVKSLDALINTPFTFPLPLSAIYYNSLATDPHAVSNYDVLAAQYNATVTAPPVRGRC